MLNTISKKTASKLESRKFMMWLFLVSITMLFAALTSAYLVKHNQGDWISIHIPSFFGYTTIVIGLSSVSMYLAQGYVKQHATRSFQTSLLITLVLGSIFLIGQYIGWHQLVASEVYLVGHPAGSFVYVLSGVHALHIIGGIIYVCVLCIQSFLPHMRFKLKQNIGMCATYWHFIGILWIYLYAFFTINQ